MRRLIVAIMSMAAVAGLSIPVTAASASDPKTTPNVYKLDPREEPVHFVKFVSSADGETELDIVDGVPELACSEVPGCYEPEGTQAVMDVWRVGKYGLPDTSVCLENRLGNIQVYKDAIAHAASQVNRATDILVWWRDGAGSCGTPAARTSDYTFYNGPGDGRCAYNHITYNSTSKVVISSHIKINTAYYSQCQAVLADRQHVETHEAVHMFGLAHRPSGVTDSIMGVSRPWQSVLTTTWDLPHLNQVYHD